MQHHYRINLYIIIKSLAVWALIIPLSIVNGFVRNSVLEPFMGKYALPASGITLCAMIFALCWFLVPRLGEGNRKTYRIVGVLWVLLSVVFEYSVGIFLLGASWTELAAAYNPASGDLWLLVLVCIGIAPLFTAKMQSRITVRHLPLASKNIQNSTKRG